MPCGASSGEKCFLFLAELFSYRWTHGIGYTDAQHSDQLLHKVVLYQLSILPSPLSCSLGSYSKINLHVSLCLRLCFQGTQAKTALIRITREVLLLPLLHRGGTRRKV